MRALQVYAGDRARAWLREHGLRAADVRVIPAAAGGPKGLVLIPLDRRLFGHWLAGSAQPVHLVGASIGAWRMASACLPDADAALARLAEDYIGQRPAHAPGAMPAPRDVSAAFAACLGEHFGGREAQVLAHPRYRLHVLASRGRGLLDREGRALSRLTTPLGYAAAYAANLASRRALGGWLERVVLSDPRAALPLPLHDYRTAVAPLRADNLQPGLLASCSVPFWLEAVRDIPGAPRGAYWDGGLTDYHLRLDYAAMAEGLVLYPHFQPQLVAGWLDKSLRRRHRADARLANVVVLAPAAEWVATLPNAKLPDRGDFSAYGDDVAARSAVWRRALGESQRLADEFAALVDRPGLAALPLP